MHLAVAILRLQEGIDYSKVVASSNGTNINGPTEKNAVRTRQNSTESLPRNQSFSQMSQGKKHLKGSKFYLFQFKNVSLLYLWFICYAVCNTVTVGPDH
jgi:hypothetical protein